MVTGILGRKIGMTQLFGDDGAIMPATVIKAGPCVVVQRKTVERDGYAAVQLGLVDDAPANANRPIAGHYRKVVFWQPRCAVAGGVARNIAQPVVHHCAFPYPVFGCVCCQYHCPTNLRLTWRRCLDIQYSGEFPM